MPLCSEKSDIPINVESCDVTIDARWHNTSGVGTYFMGILPYLLDYLSNCSVCILVPAKDFDYFSSKIPQCVIKAMNSEILSFSEQYELAQRIPRRSKIFYTPVFTLPFLFHGKIICTIHDVLQISRPRYVSSWIYAAFAYVYYFICSLKAYRIFTVSKYSISEIVRFFPWSKGRLRLSYPGFKQLSSASLRNNFQNLLSCKYFLYVGNAKPHKNLITLVKAFINEFGDSASINLFLVGKFAGFKSGTDVSYLSEILQDYPNIRILGSVTDNDLFHLYKNAVGLVFPSFYEGFGMPPLEALYLGTPVIASNSSPMPEILGDAVMYFNPSDPLELSRLMRYLLDNRDAHSKASSLEVLLSRYNWESCASQIIDEFSMILS